MRLPWVSRSTFHLVLEAKNEVIAYQRDQIRELREALVRPVNVTVALPKDFAVLHPAVVTKPSRKKKRDEGENALVAAAANVDLTTLDENDDRTLMVVAVGKNGRTAHNQYEMRQWVRTLRVEVKAAKAAKRRRESLERDEPETPQLELQAGEDLDSTVDVPAHIREQIEIAERGE